MVKVDQFRTSNPPQDREVAWSRVVTLGFKQMDWEAASEEMLTKLWFPEMSR